MKYFKLKNNKNIREIGKYPQASVKFWGDLDTIPYTGRRSPIQKDWNIPEPLMHKKAKATTLLDVMPFSPAYFLTFKDDFIKFLNNFNVDNFSTWQLKVHQKENILNDYKLFHLSYPSDGKFIDFKKSNFIVRPKGVINDTTSSSIKINDLNNYLNSIEILEGSKDDLIVSYDKLVLDFSNATEDIIRFIDVPSDIGYYVSEQLKIAIEKEGFTGMAFQEIEEMDNRIKVMY